MFSNEKTFRCKVDVEFKQNSNFNKIWIQFSPEMKTISDLKITLAATLNLGPLMDFEIYLDNYCLTDNTPIEAIRDDETIVLKKRAIDISSDSPKVNNRRIKTEPIDQNRSSAPNMAPNIDSPLLLRISSNPSVYWFNHNNSTDTNTSATFPMSSTSMSSTSMSSTSMSSTSMSSTSMSSTSMSSTSMSSTSMSSTSMSSVPRLQQISSDSPNVSTNCVKLEPIFCDEMFLQPNDIFTDPNEMSSEPNESSVEPNNDWTPLLQTFNSLIGSTIGNEINNNDILPKERPKRTPKKFLDFILNFDDIF